LNSKTGKVMVIGGGIAGLTAAWELSRQNINVELVEKTCFLGGHSIGFTCKATDTCKQCGACSVEEMLANVVNEPLINVHLRTQVSGLEKKEGFSVSLSKSAVEEVAPQSVLKGFSHHNSPLYVVVDGAKDAPEEAVNIESLGSEGAVDVDAVVVATGYTPFDPNIKSTYGYDKWDNVITGLDLENIIRENGSLVRPSDGEKPKRIAFIQCVGSRDERLGNLWCSEVCCPYAMRMAGVAKNADPEAEISMFYIDIQNSGKEFPVFYERIKEDVRFVRTIPVDIYPLEGDSLELRHMAEDEGMPSSEQFDLVVLSVGLMPGMDTAKISEILNIPVNQDGFLDIPAGDSGVFVAGTAGGPGSIAATIAGAGNVALATMNYLGGSK